MPTTGELITSVYQNFLNIGDSDQEEPAVRIRLLFHLKRAVSDFWADKPWPFRVALVGSALAFAGDSSMLVPADFASVGPHTRLWKVGDSQRIHYQPARRVRARLREAPNTSSPRPEIWSLLGQRSTNLETPAAPTVTPIGGNAGQAYEYKVVALLEDGVRHSAASPAGATADGVNGLNASHFNRITWAAIAGAHFYDVYRTVNDGGLPTPPPVKVASLITETTFDDQGQMSVAAVPPATQTAKGYANLIVFADKASADIQFELADYVRAEPVLIDEVISGTASDGETLKQIPEQYHNVFEEYLAKRLMRDEGDDREPLQDADFRRALAGAWAQENPDQLGDDFMACSYGEYED